MAVTGTLAERKVPRGVSRYPRRAGATTVCFLKQAADGAADTETSDAIFRAESGRDFKLQSACFIPHDTLTANDTNYATLAIKVSTTALASASTTTTGTGDWSDNTAVELTLASAVAISAGDVLLADIAKGGSGVAVPIGVWQLTLVEDDA